LTEKASQPLCIKEDDLLEQEAGGDKIMMSMVEYDAKGTVVSKEDTETTELHSLPQGSFKILEALYFME
jgi:hypothetical protein